MKFTFTRISDVGTFNGSPTIEVDKMTFHLNTHMLTLGLAYHW
jgi:hypothetical protein